MTLYKIKQECYLLGALVNAGAQHTLKGRLVCLVAESCLTQGEGEGGGPNAQRKVLCVDFSCLSIKHEFYFIAEKNQKAKNIL